MPADEYSLPVSSGGGKLKLKGVKDSKVDKHKKKKKGKPETDSISPTHEANKKSMEKESQEPFEEAPTVDEGDGSAVREKTEAEKRHEEMRRKRVSGAFHVPSSIQETSPGPLQRHL